MKIFEGFTTSPTTISITSSSSPIVSVGILIGLNEIDEFSAIEISGNFALVPTWIFKLAKDGESLEAVVAVDILLVRKTAAGAVVIVTVEGGDEVVT